MLTCMMEEQHAAEPPVPGIAPHPRPPHCPQLAAQQTAPSWKPGKPLVQTDDPAPYQTRCQKEQRETHPSRTNEIQGMRRAKGTYICSRKRSNPIPCSWTQRWQTWTLKFGRVNSQQPHRKGGTTEPNDHGVSPTILRSSM